MKTAVLTGIRELEIVDQATPDIQKDNDVLLRIDAVGVCGSDIHYYTTGRIGSQIVEYPYPVGHEAMGTVQAVGPGVTSLAPGDRVAIDPAVSCWQCDQCLAGRPHTCRNLVFLGCPGQIDGCLSEYYVMPEESCYKVSPEMTDVQAALIEPLSIGVYAVRQSIPMPGAKVGILGAGPIGLCVLTAAKAAGATEFYVTDPLAYRREIAAENGAKWTGHPDEDAVGQISAQEPLLLDVVFECCGEQAALDQSLELLKPGGKLMVIGIPEGPRISFEIDRLRRQEITIYNVRRQNECVRPAIDLIESGQASVDFMHTHDFRMDECKQAFDLVDAYADGVIKAVVAP